MKKHDTTPSLIIEGVGELIKTDTIQSLWSGYGEISRYSLSSDASQSYVLKHVKLPDQANHPRGWNTDLSHQRKVTSYHVETTWYRAFSHQCDGLCRVPRCVHLSSSETEFLMVLEDLDACGFANRRSVASLDDMKACLDWLANFHALFMMTKAEGLWPKGTYWHLDTRPDELEAMSDLTLKAAASSIDQFLDDCPYQTLVHGDAKLANFCFKDREDFESTVGFEDTVDDLPNVAAVDFQYVGGGCGMKDVAYFIGSCLDEHGCEQHHQVLLDHYFDVLKQAILDRDQGINPDDVEQAWRPLFAVAWADFHRFLQGWSPDHWKLHGFSDRLTRQALANLSLRDC